MNGEMESGSSIRSFYGQKSNSAFVKVKKLTDSDIESFCRSSSLADDKRSPRLAKRRNKQGVYLGSKATGHKVKRSKRRTCEVRVKKVASGQRKSKTEDVNRSGSTEASTTDDDVNGMIPVDNDDRDSSVDNGLRHSKRQQKQRLSKEKQQTPQKPSKRQASILAAKRVAMACCSDSSDEESSFDVKMKFYRGRSDDESSVSEDSDSSASNYSDSSNKKTVSKSNGHTKVKTSTARKVKKPAKPEFSEYEKAAQEKVALRMEYLKSLKILSDDDL